MKKVAIVGVEGSGKTVMLAGLGDLYTYPGGPGAHLGWRGGGRMWYTIAHV